MTTTTYIILIIIVLHLVAGFAWLMYKLSPREGDQLIDSQDELEENKSSNSNQKNTVL